MQKSMRLCDFHYPYAILISKLPHYFEVDIEGELAEIIKPSSEINSGSLSKMGFTKIGGRWVSKDGDQAGSSGTNEGDEPEDATTQDEPTAETQEAGHNDAYIVKGWQQYLLLKDLWSKESPCLWIKIQSYGCTFFNSGWTNWRGSKSDYGTTIWKGEQSPILTFFELKI